VSCKTKSSESTSAFLSGKLL